MSPPWKVVSGSQCASYKYMLVILTLYPLCETWSPPSDFELIGIKFQSLAA